MIKDTQHVDYVSLKFLFNFNILIAKFKTITARDDLNLSFYILIFFRNIFVSQSTWLNFKGYWAMTKTLYLFFTKKWCRLLFVVLAETCLLGLKVF